jgi:anti-sigma B factor antagonist
MTSGRCGPLSWTVDRSSTCSTVSVEGELDLAVIGPLRKALDDVIADDVVIVDLSGVTFIDSTGLRLLIDVKRGVEGGGGALFIRDVSEAVARVLDVSGTASFFERRLPDVSEQRQDHADSAAS